MARIPFIDAPQVQQVRLPAGAPSGDFGSVGEGIARGLGQAVDALARIGDREREKHDAAAVLSYDTQAGEWMRDRWAEVEKIKGKDALNVAAPRVAEFDKLIKDNREALPERLRFAYDRMMLQRREQWATTLARHEKQQADALADGEFRGAVSGALADIKQFVTDPAAVRSAKARGMAAIMARAKSEGWGDAERDGELAQFEASVLSVTKPHEQKQKAFDAVTAAQKKYPGDLAAQRTALRAQFEGDAELWSAADTLAIQDAQREDAAEAQTNTPILERVQLAIKRTGRLDRTSDDYLALSNKYKVKAQDYEDSTQRVLRAETRADREALRRDALEAEGELADMSVDEFLSVNLSADWRNKLEPAGKYDKWVQRQRRLAEAKAKKDAGQHKAEAYTIGEAVSTAKSMFADKPFSGTDDQRRASARILEDKIEEWHAKWVADNRGTLPSESDVRAEVEFLTAPVGVQRSLFGFDALLPDKKTQRFLVRSDEKVVEQGASAPAPAPAPAPPVMTDDEIAAAIRARKKREPLPGEIATLKKQLAGGR